MDTEALVGESVNTGLLMYIHVYADQRDLEIGAHTF